MASVVIVSVRENLYPAFVNLADNFNPLVKLRRSVDSFTSAIVIQYDTSFEHKKSAVETITPMLDKDGKWRMSGYFIR